ncbi:monovalent cation/H(+) antiporter subunit G [Candidatus Poribacteria bacterium]|nr:monovalent cation/H(+) antiporter subunit G [Candidatus Poribacteria bacterium]
MDIVSIIFIITGTFFLFAATIGLILLPDFYTRMHACGKCDTLGILLIIIGLGLYNGLSLTSAKILLIAALIFLTSPTATHSISRAALKNKLPHWTKEKGK